MNETKNPRQTPRFKQKRRRKIASVAAVVCFVAAIAIVGTYTFKDYRETQRELAKAEKETKEQSKSANTDNISNSEADLKSGESTSQANSADAGEDGMADGTGTNSRSEDADGTGEDNGSAGTDADGANANGTDSASQTAANGKSVSFSEGSKLLWPVEGVLLMDYSMDKTVYFSTLDQFKYNPALVIEGEKGDQVISSAPGIVKSIDKSAETGTTVNVDIGSGYELFYGQLSDVQVKTGDYVDSKTVLGYVGEPTIYYSVEGANVYFEMRKDGQPIDPMDYLVE